MRQRYLTSDDFNVSDVKRVQYKNGASYWLESTYVRAACQTYQVDWDESLF